MTNLPAIVEANTIDDIEPTSDGELEQKLESTQGVKREYLLLRILGLDHDTILKVLDSEDYLSYWKKDKNFSNILKQSKKLGKTHQDEAITLVRQSNKVTMVAMEQLLARKLLQEVIDDKPMFIKTHLGREVYNRMMNQLDSVGKKNDTGAWEEMIFRRGTTT